MDSGNASVGPDVCPVITHSGCLGTPVVASNGIKQLPDKPFKIALGKGYRGSWEQQYKCNLAVAPES